ncbi:MAG: tryptophan synthase subunit alpha [Candidatus Lokiarchaeota archaeon]|nr:tryptophan synthase subunit alpha [Candidatus Lokiarchaeota archaeon]
MSRSNRINRLFKENKKKYFMPFLVAGDPNLDQFKSLVLAIEPYADILEIGIPFSDPIADGPTIQEANTRAFNAGINTKLALEAIKDIRTKTDKPIVILTYYNILIQGAETIEKSLDRTFKLLKTSGVDGVVIGDLPIEEAELTLDVCEKYDICLIFLIAPSTTEERLTKVFKVARGFVYLISLMGITGARETLAQITKDTIKKVKDKTKKLLPVLVGFGISKPEHATAIVEAGADGVIIGSAIVKIVKENIGDYKIMETKMVKFVSCIKKSIERLN